MFDPEKKFAPNLLVMAEAEFRPADDVLVVELELRPGTPIQHEMLKALVNGMNWQIVDQSAGDLLKLKAVFGCPDLVMKAQDAMDFKRAADARGMTVEQLQDENAKAAESQKLQARDAAAPQQKQRSKDKDETIQ